MRGGFAPSLRRNATAEAYNAAAPPGLISTGGAATVGKRLSDGEMTFAISVFVDPSNELAMLLVGQSEDPIQIFLAFPRRAGCAITRLT